MLGYVVLRSIPTFVRVVMYLIDILWPVQFMPTAGSLSQMGHPPPVQGELGRPRYYNCTSSSRCRQVQFAQSRVPWQQSHDYVCAVVTLGRISLFIVTQCTSQKFKNLKRLDKHSTLYIIMNSSAGTTMKTKASEHAYAVQFNYYSETERLVSQMWRDGTVKVSRLMSAQSVKIGVVMHHLKKN